MDYYKRAGVTVRQISYERNRRHFSYTNLFIQLSAALLTEMKRQLTQQTPEIFWF